MNFSEFALRLEALGVKDARLKPGTSFTSTYRGITRAALRVDDLGSGQGREYTDLDVAAFVAVDRWRALRGRSGGGHDSRLPSGIRDAIEAHPEAHYIATTDGETFEPVSDPESWIRQRLSSPDPFVVLPVEKAMELV